jgi:hypothetical protein
VLSDIGNIPVWAVFLAGVFGLMLSLLFFMDQNVSSALANSKDIYTSKSFVAFYTLSLFRPPFEKRNSVSFGLAYYCIYQCFPVYIWTTLGPWGHPTLPSPRKGPS